MSTLATAYFDMEKWEELALDDIANHPRVTRASIHNRYRGDFVGTGVAEVTMVYGVDGSAAFTGYERTTGAMNGRQGTFVLKVQGILRQGALEGDYSVVSGTADFLHMTGTGEFQTLTDGHVTRITYAIDQPVRA